MHQSQPLLSGNAAEKANRWIKTSEILRKICSQFPNSNWEGDVPNEGKGIRYTHVYTLMELHPERCRVAASPHSAKICRNQPEMQPPFYQNRSIAFHQIHQGGSKCWTYVGHLSPPRASMHFNAVKWSSSGKATSIPMISVWKVT